MPPCKTFMWVLWIWTLVLRLVQKAICPLNNLPIPSLFISKLTCLQIYLFRWPLPRLYIISNIWKCFRILNFPPHNIINKIRIYIFIYIYICSVSNFYFSTVWQLVSIFLNSGDEISSIPIGFVRERTLIITFGFTEV